MHLDKVQNLAYLNYHVWKSAGCIQSLARVGFPVTS